jgi:predicted AAA+ superfamily ATPase
MRTDAGPLWENFCVAERRKVLEYLAVPASMYFWRTYGGSEIDYIETRDGRLHAFEFKYGKKQARIPEPFAREYPDADFTVVNPDNYLEFMTTVKRP